MSTMRNSVMLIGRPGADPTVKTFENNRSVLHFNLAVNESYQNTQKEWVTDTQWFNIVAWDKMAENMAKHLQKGRRVAINGKLRNRDWTDNKGRHFITEILVSDFVLIDKEEKPD